MSGNHTSRRRNHKRREPVTADMTLDESEDGSSRTHRAREGHRLRRPSFPARGSKGKVLSGNALDGTRGVTKGDPMSAVTTVPRGEQGEGTRVNRFQSATGRKEDSRAC